jgi:hypothetical protein
LPEILPVNIPEIATLEIGQFFGGLSISPVV